MTMRFNSISLAETKLASGKYIAALHKARAYHDESYRGYRKMLYQVLGLAARCATKANKTEAGPAEIAKEAGAKAPTNFCELLRCCVSIAEGKEPTSKVVQKQTRAVHRLIKQGTKLADLPKELEKHGIEKLARAEAEESRSLAKGTAREGTPGKASKTAARKAPPEAQDTIIIRAPEVARRLQQKAGRHVVFRIAAVGQLNEKGEFVSSRVRFFSRSPTVTAEPGWRASR